MAATGARRALIVAVALSCLVVRAEAYLRTESGKTSYECDITKVKAFTASENKERCLQFCTRCVPVPGAVLRFSHRLHRR